ncbi:SGNH/GDSL hydrolase family protein [Rhodobacteraceae bacterium RKSG542]|uniref:SGNH/GDSL hydrolase family protein n=1 Tax=Pseudovibrio flavus TaxID=2529854 RepID=UPI0012BBBB87|nr:SGNH/GDSL hydrolase family protein [Pseudovibrio flavus]MTI18788.1 SGNH/GDSL hydrolase family protein [Pseudovibrio flavus]
MYLRALLSLPLFPLYAVEGIRTRMSTPRLRPGRGTVYGSIAGNGEALRLLVIGDSTVAGVGVDSLEDALPHQIAKALNAQTGRPVHWRAAGCNGATSTQVRDHALPHTPQDDYTHVYLSCGFNDLKNFKTKKKWKDGFGGLLYAVRVRYPNANVYWSQMMEPHLMPALKPGLAFVLGLRRQMINDMGNALCEERGAHWIAPMPDTGPQHFSRDGIHPSLEGNIAWANHVTEFISANEADELLPENEERKLSV